MEEVKYEEEVLKSSNSEEILDPLASTVPRPISNKLFNNEEILQQEEEEKSPMSNKSSDSVLHLTESELDNKIGASVCSYTTKSNLIKKHVYYIIQGHDSSGAYEAHRTSKDFRTLRSVLVHNWPGCYIPPVPPKQSANNINPRFIDKMMKLYNLFISRIVSYNYLYESDEFQQFIKNPGVYHKLLLRKQPYQDISPKFTKIFKDYSKEIYNEQNEKTVNEGRAFFKIGIEALEKFENLCKINVDYFENFEAELSQLMTGVNSLSKFYQEQYGSKALSVSSREIYSNPFFVLLDWVRWEIIDLKAMIDAIDTKKEIDKRQMEIESKMESEKTRMYKIQAGKKMLSQIFSTNSRERSSQLLESSIGDMQKEVIALSNISTISAAKLANLDIPKFKQLKAQKYEVILRTFAGSSIHEFENMISQVKEIEEVLNSKE